ncbi:unnamed protein product [Nippostrongylus brasiliensis]|uniref:Pilus assembly protein CpaF n=1 Tax=Nippostrongylus brasiliensis TaxID=27835 RepID=A0A0N4XTN9_NIPBR|nr:unnamed protein product [Nippostrongylus brasiliensis]
MDRVQPTTAAIRAEDESIAVRGQLNIIGDGEEISGSGFAEDSNEKLFDELPSLRIAREYLRRKIAEERRLEGGNEPI